MDPGQINILNPKSWRICCRWFSGFHHLCVEFLGEPTSRSFLLGVVFFRFFQSPKSQKQSLHPFIPPLGPRILPKTNMDNCWKIKILMLNKKYIRLIHDFMVYFPTCHISFRGQKKPSPSTWVGNYPSPLSDPDFGDQHELSGVKFDTKQDYYCWWKRSCDHQLRLVVCLSHYLQGFTDPRWWGFLPYKIKLCTNKLPCNGGNGLSWGAFQGSFRIILLVGGWSNATEKYEQVTLDHFTNSNFEKKM